MTRRLRARLNALALLAPLALATGAGFTGVAAAGDVSQVPGAPPWREGQYVHVPPSVDALREASDIHPQLKAAILRGRDLFLNTQALRGRYVFNDLSCRSCHPTEGRTPWAGPVWPAATTLPDFRGKNGHVNTLEERIGGCFTYSMNGQPPPHGSDEMVALIAYHRWLATGAPVYERNIYGRGFSHLGTGIPPDTSRERGRDLYAQRCAACHGEDGEGQTHRGSWLSPPLWGDRAYNWGSGMSRIFTAAAFIHLNMPFGQGGSLTPQQAWDLALFINSHERPQDPRHDGDVARTRARYADFHRHTLYGTEVDGRILGAHDNTGDKPFLRPSTLRLREASDGE